MLGVLGLLCHGAAEDSLKKTFPTVSLIVFLVSGDLTELQQVSSHYTINEHVMWSICCLFVCFFICDLVEYK